MHWI
jgi:hypothetical protein